MRNLFIKQFNNKKFVFIDSIKYKNEIIYHFANFEEQIFCTKIYEKYVPITDKFKLNVIKNIYGNIYDKKIYDIKYLENLKNKKKLILKKYKEKKVYRASDVEKLSPEDIEMLVTEAENNFSNINKKYNLNLNIDKIVERLRNIKLYKSNSPLNSKIRGFYYDKRDFIMFYNENHKKNDVIGKRTRFHEIIHSITGKKCSKYRYRGNIGLLEGETENLVEAYFGENKDGEWCDSKFGANRTIKIPFSKETAYPYNVAIVRQMELLLGEKSYKSVLNGNMEFEKDFADKYGLPLMVFLAYRATRMVRGGKNLDIIKYFDETQNILMKKAFDKEFEKVDKIEDVDKYFNKLITFGQERGKIEINGRISNDVYIKYFYEKLNAMKEKLTNKEFSDEEINNKLEKYKNIEEQYELLYESNKTIKNNNKEDFLNSIITKGKKTIRTNNLLSLAKKIKNQFKRKEQKKEIAENDISKEN